MADKITNFEDYVNREGKSGRDEAPVGRPAEGAGAESSQSGDKQKVDPGLTQEILQIEIEDPLQFFTEEERREYYRQQNGAAEDETAVQEPRRPAGEPEGAAEKESREREPGRREERPVRPRRRAEDDYDQEEYPDEEFDEEFDEEEYRDEDESSGVNMDLVVRAASIITGLIILVFIGFALKVKVYDRYFAPDPDQVEAPAPTAIPEGYTEKNDTVIVTGASSLNLRSVPSTESKDSIVATADEGTELKRIAVSSDGSWALVEYQGQQVYGAMKYLKEK